MVLYVSLLRALVVMLIHIYLTLFTFSSSRLWKTNFL